MKGETYEEFIAKFNKEQPKTTDDCYTPKETYEIIRDHFIQYYKLNNYNIVRPFYPGGDYQNEKYNENDVVIDNPPFSILSKIIKYYTDNNIKFILFGPTLTIFHLLKYNITIHFINKRIIYDGNINIQTCFITNLENENAVISDLELDKKLQKLKPKKRDIKKFTPKNYITSAQFKKYVKYGINIKKSDIIDLKSEYNKKKTYGNSIVVKEDNIPWEI